MQFLGVPDWKFPTFATALPKPCSIVEFSRVKTMLVPQRGVHLEQCLAVEGLDCSVTGRLGHARPARPSVVVWGPHMSALA